MLNLTESKADKKTLKIVKKLVTLYRYYLNEYVDQNKPSTDFKSSNKINLKSLIASTYIWQLDDIEKALYCESIDRKTIAKLEALLFEISQDEQVAPKVKEEIKAAAKNSEELDDSVAYYMHAIPKTEAQDDKEIIETANVTETEAETKAKMLKTRKIECHTVNYLIYIAENIMEEHLAILEMYVPGAPLTSTTGPIHLYIQSIEEHHMHFMSNDNVKIKVVTDLIAQIIKDFRVEHIVKLVIAREITRFIQNETEATKILTNLCDSKLKNFLEQNDSSNSPGFFDSPNNSKISQACFYVKEIETLLSHEVDNESFYELIIKIFSDSEVGSDVKLAILEDYSNYLNEQLLAYINAATTVADKPAVASNLRI